MDEGSAGDHVTADIVRGFILFLKGRGGPLPETWDAVAASLEQFYKRRAFQKKYAFDYILHRICFGAGLARVRKGSHVLWNEARVEEYIEKAEVTPQDVVDALLSLVDASGGELPGDQLRRLYAMNRKFKGVVDASGGPKQFCLKNPELEFVTTFGGPGYMKRREAEVSSQDVVDALLALVDDGGGEFSGSQLPRLYAMNSKFKAIIDDCGGPKKFCLNNPELEFVTTFGGPGHMKRREAEVSSQDVVDALLGLVDDDGGQFPGNQLPRLYAMNIKFKSIIDTSGGPKKFCLKNPELEFVTTFGGPGYMKRREAEVSSQDIVDALLALVDEGGGEFSGSQLPRLYAMNSKFKAIIDDCGGPKKFCLNNPELEFVTTFGGPGHMKRREAEVSSQDVVDALLCLVSEHGGRLSGGHLSLLYGKCDGFKDIVDDAGGLKQFCMNNRELDFVTTVGGDGFVKRREEALSAQDVVNVLLMLVDEHGGKLFASQVASLLPDIQHKDIIDAAGGLKEFCMHHGALEYTRASRGHGCIQRAGPIDRISLTIDQVLWSQDCVKIRFRSGKLLVDTLQEVLDDPSLIDRLPLLEVVEREGRFYAVSGNRRLWVLKEFSCLHQSGKSGKLYVRVRLRNARWASMEWVQRRFTTKCDGVRVAFCLRYHMNTRQRFLSMGLALAAEMKKLQLDLANRQFDNSVHDSTPRQSASESSDGGDDAEDD